MNANLPTRDIRDVTRAGVQCGARLVTIFILLSLLAACGELNDDVEGQAFAAVPSQFTDNVVVSGVAQPTDVAFTPDGRMLIAQQGGKLLVRVNGSLRSTPALDLTSKVCTNSERGLLGVAVDPQYPSNHFIYVFYTHKWGTCTNNSVANSPQNRVSRFVYNPATDTASGETVILDRILSLGANHNGGDLAFGSDELLYVTSGDSGCQINNGGICGGGNTNAKFKGNLSGKILRITRDGDIPADNPFVGAPGARRCGAGPEMPIQPVADLNDNQPCTEIFAYGLRNPFRFAFQPGTNRFFINDVGQNRWEEIDEGARGANYGWNDREAHCANGQDCGPFQGGVANLIYAYGRGEGCVSITGGAFVPNGVFGASFDGAYLFADYGCGRIFKLVRNSSGAWVRSDFATQLGGSSATSLTFGPSANGLSQSLYYTTYAGGGQVRRIEFTGAINGPPTAVLQASPTTASAPPLLVNFDASASFDSDPGDRVAEYEWKFGDGQGTTTTTPTASHNYTQSGVFTATLRVKDTRGAFSQPVSKEITTNNGAPRITITSPAEGATFIVGQEFRLRATVTDPEDGTIPNSRLSWEVLRRHDQHTHPYFPSTTGNDLAVTGAAPEDLAAAGNSHLEVWLTATDSRGLTTKVKREIFPNEVAISLATQPAGLKLTMNGDELNQIRTPATLTSWEGWDLPASAPTQTDASGVTWRFSSWSDGVNTATRTIRTTGSPASYTAIFAQGGFSARINFQPIGSPVPADYVADTGLPFGARNGLSYGWNATTNETRDRGLHTDQRFDTLNHMQKPSNPNARWEIQVPNGSYKVRVVSGDPGHFDSVFHMLAEGVQVFNVTPTTAQRFADGTVTVHVTDGRLTLTNGTAARNNKINFIEITPP